MKKRIFIVLFIIWTIGCTAQSEQGNSQSTKPTKSEQENGVRPKSAGEEWQYSVADSMYFNYEYFDTLQSPDSNFKIIVRNLGISQQSTKYQYWLIRVKENDATEIIESICRDYPAPNIYWASNNYLIYEERAEGEIVPKPQIHMRDLTTNEINFSTEGFIPVGRKWSENFFDNKNQILIFFMGVTEEMGHKINLMELEIKKKSVKKLFTLGKLDMDFPIVNLDKEKRVLTTEYFDFSEDKMVKLSIEY